MTDHYRTLEEWQPLILECRSSGMTDAEWCRINGIAKNAFYSALKRLRKEVLCLILLNYYKLQKKNAVI